MAELDVRYADDLFKGTGTSQAAAATSGLAAVIIGQNPTLQPDQVKVTMTNYANSIASGTTRDGFGLVDDDTAELNPLTNGAAQRHSAAAMPGGRISVPTGATWSGGTWSGSTWSGSTWSGGTWSGSTWSGGTWSGGTWSGGTWSGQGWSRGR